MGWSMGEGKYGERNKKRVIYNRWCLVWEEKQSAVISILLVVFLMVLSSPPTQHNKHHPVMDFPRDG